MMSDLFDKAVGFSLKVSRYGNRRKVNPNLITTDADRRRIAVGKKLLDSPELEAIAKGDREFRSWLENKALPSMFRSGIWLLPLELVTTVDERMLHYSTGRALLIDAFIATYDDQVVAAKTSLGSLFDQGDYPSHEKMRASFSVDHQYVEFRTPQNLAKIRAGMVEEERERMAVKMESAMEGIRALLRKTMQDLLDHAVSRLGENLDGKRKVLHETVLTNISEFVGTFKARNICDDAELDAVVDKVKALNEGITIKDLRSDEALRDAYRAAASKLKAQMDTLVSDAPERDFGD